MDERQRLIAELLKSEPISERKKVDDWHDGEIEDIADSLIDAGISFLPWKKGDLLFSPFRDIVFVDEITGIKIDPNGVLISIEGDTARDGTVISTAEIGENYFMSHEEAEAVVRRNVEDRIKKKYCVTCEHARLSENDCVCTNEAAIEHSKGDARGRYACGFWKCKEDTENE